MASRSTSLDQRSVVQGMTTSILVWSTWKSRPVRIASKNSSRVSASPVSGSGVRFRVHTTWSPPRKKGLPPARKPAGVLWHPAQSLAAFTM